MDKDLQSRFEQFELPPPPGSWERLADALDHEGLQFPGKLYRYETAPPPGAWKKIASSIIEVPVETKVVPMRFNRKKIGLIAAAAAVIIALVIIFPFNNPSGNEPVPSGTVNAGLILETKPVKILPDTGSQPTSVGEEEAYITVSKTPAKKHRSRVYKEDPGPIAMLDYAPAQINSQRRFSIIDADEKYMTYTDDEGYVSRLPKKLYDIFECATRELVCRQKIRDLQSRVASSAVSSDFTGVLEILRNLQENQ